MLKRTESKPTVRATQLEDLTFYFLTIRLSLAYYVLRIYIYVHIYIYDIYLLGRTKGGFPKLNSHQGEGVLNKSGGLKLNDRHYLISYKYNYLFLGINVFASPSLAEPTASVTSPTS